jgi:hypothetical protein
VRAAGGLQWHAASQQQQQARVLCQTCLVGQQRLLGMLLQLLLQSRLPAAADAMAAANTCSWFKQQYRQLPQLQ